MTETMDTPPQVVEGVPNDEGTEPELSELTDVDQFMRKQPF